MGSTVVFWTARAAFERWAHEVSASAMFLCLIAVIALNALGVARARAGPAARTATLVMRSLRTGYAAVGVAMVISLLVVAVLRFADVQSAHLVLLLEAALIVEFAAFWVIQTRELWSVGVRGAAAPPAEDG